MRLRRMVAAGMLVGMSQLCGICGPSGPAEGEEACSDEGAPAVADVQLGTGDAGSFQVLTSERQLASEVGSQGGSHVFMTLRAAMPEESPNDDGWTLAVRLFNVANVEVGSAIRYEVESCCGSWTEIVNEPVFLTGEETSGPLRAEIRLLAGGSANSDTATVVAERVYEFADVR